MRDLVQRPRRLRHSAVLRDLVAETHLDARRLMLPHFVVAGDDRRVPIDAMPGIDRLSIDALVTQVEADLTLGIRQVLLFGVPEASDKDPEGRAAAAPDGLVPRAVQALKKRFGSDLLVATDVCLCAYTDHGHCGVLRDGDVDNDATLPPLAAMALAHAAAGADVVAPSDMMDGRVGAIRQRLDAQHLSQTVIMSYSAKYASAYYGPFRVAAASAPSRGDRKSYQMDSRSRRDALREVACDAQEGADIVMVKPALAYLDIIAAVRANTHLPVACYNVSGEYSMVKAAAANGWVDEPAVVRENLYAMARAGADVIITYHARDALRGQWLA
jgi:porphobilinogen synthase